MTNNNDGAAGAVPVYTGSATLGNSPIAVSGGNVGIGTTAPAGLLDVNSSGGGLVVSGANLDPRGSYSLVPLKNTGKLLEGWNMSQGAGEIDLISNRGGGGCRGSIFFYYFYLVAVISLYASS